MADQDKEKQETDQEKTIGKEPVPPKEATNGETSEEALHEEVEETTAEIADLYAKAKEELYESVSKLRYELSKLDVEQARQRARTWVEENPTLAVFLAMGAGIAVGRLLSSALKPAPPPTLSERLMGQSRSLASQARHYAHDIGEAVVEHAAEAGDFLAKKTSDASDVVRQRARELGETVAEHVGDIASAAVERAAGWGDDAAQRARQAAHGMQEGAHEATHTVRSRASHAGEFAESALSTAKTVLAAFVVKKVTDWIRRVS